MSHGDVFQGIPAEQAGSPAGAPPPPSSSSATTVSPGLYHILVPFKPLNREMEIRVLPKMAMYNGILGVLVMLAGIAALLNPVTFGIAVETFLGWLLAAGGVSYLISALLLCPAPGSIPILMVGIVDVAFGGWLIFSPEDGVFAIAAILALWFFLHGVSKIFLAVTLMGLTVWILTFISGIASLVLSALVFMIFPSNPAWILGVIVGADLFTTGVGLASVGCCAHMGSRLGDRDDRDDPLLSSSYSV